MKAFLTGASCLRCLTIIKANWCDSAVWVARLYNNDYTPTCGSIQSDFNNAYDTGDFVLTGSYSAPAIEGQCRAMMRIALIQWTLSLNTPQTVYGWYVSDLTGAVVLAQRFETPINLTSVGDKVSIKNHRFRVKGR